MTRDKLIEAALKLYAQNGYHGSTMRKIASEANIKPGSIYFFFENKDKLFTEVFIHILEKHQGMMKEIYEKNKHKHTKDVLVSMIKEIVAYHKTDSEGTKAYISLLTTDSLHNEPYIQSYMANFSDWLTRLIGTNMINEDENIKPESITRVTDQFMLIANGVFWSVNVLNDEALENQMSVAVMLIEQMFASLYQENDLK